MTAKMQLVIEDRFESCFHFNSERLIEKGLDSYELNL